MHEPNSTMDLTIVVYKVCLRLSGEVNPTVRIMSQSLLKALEMVLLIWRFH